MKHEKYVDTTQSKLHKKYYNKNAIVDGMIIKFIFISYINMLLDIRTKKFLTFHRVWFSFILKISENITWYEQGAPHELF